MKKNMIMRVASALLILTLLSTCAISGTFAKYVTSDNARDSARVAKFGVIVTAWDDSMYKTEYASADEEAYAASTVISVDTAVVAPGTADATGVTFSITGKPEVAVNVDIQFNITNDVFLNNGTYADATTGTNDDEYTVATPYYPVVFTLTHNGTSVATGNLKNIKDYLEGNSVSKDVAAKTDLGDAATNYGTYTLTWAWAIGADDAQNRADTTLGNLAAGEAYTAPTYTGDSTLTELKSATGASSETDGNYNLNIEYDIVITVTQID